MKLSNRYKIVKDNILGEVIQAHEPYLEKKVAVAIINHEKKEIRPTHGYFNPHKYGKYISKYAESIGYKFNNN
jgi:hypothetical protein